MTDNAGPPLGRGISEMQRKMLEATGRNGCFNCRSSWRSEDGHTHCGHAVDDQAIAEGGPNPIWAVRKYSEEGIAKIIAAGSDGTHNLPVGLDCENLAELDGKDCATWEARP